MRRSRYALIFVFVLATATATAQQTSPPTVQAPQRDPQALAVLSKMFSVTGWGAPTDAVAAGTITYNRGNSEDTVNVTFKFKGRSETRVDVADPAAPRSTVINGEEATFTGAAGVKSIPARSTLSPSVALPIFSSLLNTSDPNLAFWFGGTETVDGQTANRIEIEYISPPDDPRPHAQRRDGHLTMWVSVASLLPIQIQYPRISRDNPTSVFTTTRVYSDYRTISGIAVPFHQDEYGGNQRISSLQLNTVSFNTGLSDTEFAIAVSAQ
jgi:hypothetical protein